MFNYTLNLYYIVCLFKAHNTIISQSFSFFPSQMEAGSPLPSPNDLKGKILIKNRRLKLEVEKSSYCIYTPFKSLPQSFLPDANKTQKVMYLKQNSWSTSGSTWRPESRASPRTCLKMRMRRRRPPVSKSRLDARHIC